VPDYPFIGIFLDITTEDLSFVLSGLFALIHHGN